MNGLFVPSTEEPEVYQSHDIYAGSRRINEGIRMLVIIAENRGLRRCHIGKIFMKPKA